MAILAIDAQTERFTLAVWDDSLMEQIVLRLSSNYDEIINQQILPWLERCGVRGEKLDFVVTSGYLSEKSPSGIHILSDAFLRNSPRQEGLQLSHLLATRFDLAVYVIDPATPGECHPQAFVTGTPELNRVPQADSYIFKYLVRLEARSKELNLLQSRFIVAHLDTENHLGALEGTDVVESLSSLDEGPFSLAQSGGLPFDSMIDLFIATDDRDEVLRILNEKGGFRGYLGAQNFQDVFVDEGEFATLIREAFVYQVAKEIGALATVLKGQVDSIILAGDLIQYEKMVRALSKRIGFLAPISKYPQNQGLEALKAGAQRVLHNEPIVNLA